MLYKIFIVACVLAILIDMIVFGLAGAKYAVVISLIVTAVNLCRNRGSRE